MLFDIPIPGIASGHAVGAVLAAILLGPSAACVALTITVAVQAMFGDGGVTALATNCFTIAFVMPFVGYGVYKTLEGPRGKPTKLRPLAAGVAGYVGLNAAALVFAVVMGIQPLIAHDAAGRPLYAPFTLWATIPGVMAGHLLVFGVVEGILTGLVVAYLQRVEPGMLGVSREESKSDVA